MTRYTNAFFAMGLILLLATCKQHSKASKDGPVTDSIPVKIVKVGSMQTSADISATGLVTTDNEARYAFKSGGIIESIRVEEGQFFQRGSLLATLNNTEVGAGLEQSDLSVEKAERDYTRAANLYKDSVYSLEQMQDAKTKLDLARKAREAVAFNAAYSKIYAGSDGFVNKKIANVGEVINAGAPVLAINETKSNHDYLLTVGVTDKEWVLIKSGQQARVTLDGFPRDTINASVFRKSQVAGTDGSFQIELKLSLNKFRPAIGMFGKARIFTSDQTRSTLIPYEALIEADGNNAFVFVLTSEGRIKRIAITITGFDNQEVYVKSELESTSQIIVSNSAFLNEQSLIKVIK